MKDLIYNYTADAIHIFMDGKSTTVPRGHVAFARILDACKRNLGADVVRKLLDPATVFVNYAEGDIQVLSNGTATFRGRELPKVLHDRLLACFKDGVPFAYLRRYIENVYTNPSARAIQELFTFLEHKNLPITERGTFLAYKAITNDWKDKHTRSVSNVIGAVPTMPRNAVCDDADVGCSFGYHAGSLEYVQGFASNYGEPDGDRIVIVEINPADVVSVPKDCGCQKLRTCRYAVLSEFTGTLPGTAVNSDMSQATSDIDDELDAMEEDILRTALGLENGAEAAVSDKVRQALQEMRQEFTHAIENLADEFGVELEDEEDL